MKNVSKIFTTVLAVSALSACTPEADFSVAAATQAQNNPDVPGDVKVPGSDTFNIAPAGAVSKVDVLFVIDNSGSMKGEQETLAAGFSDFIEAFIAKKVDFQIGAITTDVAGTDAASWASRLPGYIRPNRGDLLTRTEGQKFLHPRTPNLASAFSNLVNVGIIGSSAEAGLKSIVHALDPVKLGAGGTNAGFIRSDALLSIVVLSDENECTVGQSIDQRIDEVLGRIGEVKRANSPGYSFHFINSINAVKPEKLPATTDIQTSCPSTWYYPSVYLRAAERTGSRTFDIANNFANELNGIGESIVSQGESRFKLSAKPATGSVKVTLGGVAVSEGATNGYVIDYAQNVIELRGTTLASAPGKSLVVTYEVAL